jgi:uncharacterized protein YcnI
MTMRKFILIAALLAAPVPALAHVVAAPGEAKAGSYSAIAFRVGHACAAGDTTLKLRVEIPDGVASARPQPKPGWTIDIEKADERPRHGRHLDRPPARRPVRRLRPADEAAGPTRRTWSSR